jgi:Sec-independent protein translocase protein TatA
MMIVFAEMGSALGKGIRGFKKAFEGANEVIKKIEEKQKP